jgi:hypothetical protein
VKKLRAELLDRTLIWRRTRLRHALREYQRHCNEPRIGDATRAEQTYADVSPLSADDVGFAQRAENSGRQGR